MANGSLKHSEAVADKWRDRFRRNARERRRARRALESLPDEVSEVTRPDVPAPGSVPAPARAVGYVLAAVTDWRRLAALLAILATAAGGGAKALGWW